MPNGTKKIYFKHKVNSVKPFLFETWNSALRLKTSALFPENSRHLQEHPRIVRRVHVHVVVV